MAGVALPGGTTVVVAKNQLASFTLFEAKDPFVQQVERRGERKPAASAPLNERRAAPTASGAGATATGDTGTTTAPPPIVYATIMLNGKPQQLEVKQKFPKDEPLFVLVSSKKKPAKIGVAGGSFDDGQTSRSRSGRS